MKIDLFCHIVDNYGDIGVCWRLARQLVRDRGCAVRLFVDDLPVFARIEPRVRTDAAQQGIAGVDILRWDGDACTGGDADAVIEAFACTLPPSVVARMRDTRPVWIDLESLSAERWVEEVHAIPSHHPQTGLTKTVFFPGFTPRTGGLLRDVDLIARRDAFQSSIPAQDAWRAAHGMPPVDPDSVDISLFHYPDAPLDMLAAEVAGSGRACRLFAPGRDMPFLTQDDYVHLLWTCDVNFVRGEESFVQAIWAGKPLIWHIYAQENGVHMVKLRAFLDLYGAESLEKFMILWNERGRKPRPDAPVAMVGWLAGLPELQAHAARFAAALAKQPDLATQLVRFINEQQKVK